MEGLLPGLSEIESAAELVYQSMSATPQYSWPLINARAGAEVWVKHENHTPVGAFKVRGGLVYMDWLRRERPEVTTVVSATRGNHGQSIAFAAAQHGIRPVIVVPFGNSVEKNRAMQALGAELIEFGEDFQAASEHGERLEQEFGWHRVPNIDQRIVTGVSTYAWEFFKACPELETVYVPIGMGSGSMRNDRGTKCAGLGDEDRRCCFEQGPGVCLVVCSGRRYRACRAAGHRRWVSLPKAASCSPGPHEGGNGSRCGRRRRGDRRCDARLLHGHPQCRRGRWRRRSCGSPEGPRTGRREGGNSAHRRECQ